MSQNKLARTRNLLSASPNWTDITPAGISLKYDFILYSWDHINVGLLASDLGVHRTDNLHDDTPTWATVLTAAEIATLMGGGGAAYSNGYKLLSSINQQGYIWLFCRNTTDNSCWCLRSTDIGDNWAASQVFGAGATFRGGADYLPKMPGAGQYLYCLARNGNRGLVRRSTDNGATWSTIVDQALTTFDNWEGFSLHVPYDQTNGDVFYWSWIDVTGSVWLFRSYFTENGGSTVNTILETGLSFSSSCAAKRHCVETYTKDRRKVSFWNPATDELWISIDAGHSWTIQPTNGLSGKVVAAGGWPFAQGRLVVETTTGFFTSSDGGLNFVDRTGDLVAAVGSLWPSGTAGGGIALQSWTNE